MNRLRTSASENTKGEKLTSRALKEGEAVAAVAAVAAQALRPPTMVMNQVREIKGV